MKSILIKLLGLILGFFIIIAAATNANAAPADAPPLKTNAEAGPFQGVFYGWVYGDEDSKAPMVLDLTHREETVWGDIYVGEGLMVDGGFCGEAAVPAGKQTASGQTNARTPDKFNASTAFEISGLEINVDIASQVAADGESLTAEAQINLPWFCGADPVIGGTLVRYHGN
ncbi:MAG: hypothetical protein R3335_08805 [Anaerolineales bacterium]|nr:hypothetical protein [Anaerolineales bacterium]